MQTLVPGPWVEDRRGTTAVIFAFILLPLLVVVGITLDTARQVGTKQRTIMAADIAALAGVRAMQDASLSEDEIKQITIDAWQANLEAVNTPPSCSTVAPEIETGTATVKLDIACSIATVLPTFFHGADSLSITHTSEAKITLPTLDIALMLDMSGSMLSGGRLADLKAAAKELVNTIVSPGTGDRVRVAIIPYGEAVNAGIYGNRAQGKSDSNDSDGDGDKVCVSQRPNPISRYTDHPPVVFHRVGDLVGIYCDEPMIIPLTSDVAKLNAAIDGMTTRATAGTAGHLGLEWSWYAISSKWADIWPSDSKPVSNDAPYARKVVVMMTDGVFKEFRTPYIWIDDRPAYEIAPEAAKEICSNMRAAGITVYAIGLDVPEATVGVAHSMSARKDLLEKWLDQYGPRQLLNHCAGDPSRYAETAESSGLVDIYASIAERLKIEAVALTE